MSIIFKTKMIQLRVEQEFFDRLSHFSNAKNTTVSAIIRDAVNLWLDQVELTAKENAEWAITSESQRLAMSAFGKHEESVERPIFSKNGKNVLE